MKLTSANLGWRDAAIACAVRRLSRIHGKDRLGRSGPALTERAGRVGKLAVPMTADHSVAQTECRSARQGGTGLACAAISGCACAIPLSLLLLSSP